MLISNKRKALFLDRDGIINIDNGYVHEPSQCEFVKGIFKVLEIAKKKRYFVVVVTNQSGIGRGYYTERQFIAFMEWMKMQLNDQIDAVYHCPFHEEDGLGKYKKKSFDRKPNPGMLLRAISENSLSPSESIMIGDKESDILAANTAKIGKAFLLSEKLIDTKFKCIQITNLLDVIGEL